MAKALIHKNGKIAEQTADDAMQMQGQLSLGSAATAFINANTNNLLVTGLNKAILLTIVSAGNNNLTGIVAPTPRVAQLLCVFNIGTGRITFVNNSASSSSDNRFAMTANRALNGGDGIMFVYDPTGLKWRSCS